MEQSNKTTKPIVVILGSTGTGKTKLSLELGTRYGGEIISADSMQVYKNLDIVTAKATKDEQKLVKHHMLDVTTIDQAFTVTHFREQALPIIDSLLADNRIPIIVGGTNYYIESLLWQILISDSVKRERFRRREVTDSRTDCEVSLQHYNHTDALDEAAKIMDRSESPKTLVYGDLEALLQNCSKMQAVDELNYYDSALLHRALTSVDPQSAERLHPNNKRKVIR
ncbi:tRNA dimethylallyltransferase [Anopheles bellator]|uniref:tRNA dimethylallyltransferase n=1 Tax=Anopheles bellator TaxID=139047 RepID=UPI0026486394|nr:tRNA dimethylallyltransferase [Anopheles bellator]